MQSGYINDTLIYDEIQVLENLGKISFAKARFESL